MDRQFCFLPVDVHTKMHIPTNENCDTSVHSRDILDKKKNQYRQRIYDYIKEHNGSTCDELEQCLDGRHETISGMITFLTNDNLLRDSGERRRTRSGRSAIVWQTVEA
jgi:predicted ArsR family transcriptional regulator